MTQKPLLAIGTFITAIFTSTMTYAEPIEVDVFYPEIISNHQQLLLTGTVEAKQNSALAPLQSGLVASLFVEQGDSVSKGQKLMALDAKLAELSVTQSKARLAASLAAEQEAKRLYQEVLTLSKKQLVAETLMAERQSGVEIAKANLAQAKAELSHQKELLARHVLYAPFSGVIAERHIDLGEWVTQQTQAFTLVEQSSLRLNLDIPQEYYSQLISAADVSVTVTPDFAQAMSINAKLDRLVAVASDSSRTFTGLVDLPDQQNLVAGMSARAEIILPNTQKSLVWLPKSAVKQHPDGGRSVFTLVDGKANRVLVKVEKQQGERIAVTGVPDNAAFVVSGVELLKQGDELIANTVDGDKL